LPPTFTNAAIAGATSNTPAMVQARSHWRADGSLYTRAKAAGANSTRNGRGGNLLDWHGIDNSILDINAALPMRRFNIVDGIVGMEGNGPIQGTGRASSVVVFGDDPVAVDARCARLMLIEPLRVPYLTEATRFLGNAEIERIEQVAERLEPYAQDFEMLEDLQHMKLRALEAASFTHA
jgi:hypothetical protein